MSTRTKTLKVIFREAQWRVLNFAIIEIFDYFHKISYPRNVSKPRNRDIKYLRNWYLPSLIIFFFLIFYQSMILITVEKIAIQWDILFLFSLKSRNWIPHSTYICRSRRCDLCLTEKYVIARANPKNLLKKKTG